MAGEKAAVVDLGKRKSAIRKTFVMTTRKGTPDCGGGAQGNYFNSSSKGHLCAE